MPYTATSNSFTNGTVDQTNHTVLCTLNGSFVDTIHATGIWRYGFKYGAGALNQQAPVSTGGSFGYLTDGGLANNYTYQIGGSAPGYITLSQLNADTTYLWAARVDGYTNPGNSPFGSAQGSTLSNKTNAVTATASTPTSSSVTSVAAHIACDYHPNTNESTCTVKLQYKKHVDVGWTDAGSADTGVTGYGLQSIARDISGLTPSTLYDVRLDIVRTTNNDTTLDSATAQFTTLGAAPTVTTNAPSGVSNTAATLNGTVNPNGIATTYKFDYGLTLGYELGSTGAQGPNSGAADVAYSQAIGPLTAGQLYHYRAHAIQGGVDYYGADQTFVTDSQGHIMPTVYQHFAKYGEATDFYFCVETPAATGSDRFLSAAVPWVAGDVLVDKDGGGLNNVANLPVRIGSTPLYKWSATAAEMSARKVNCLLVDVTASAAWRDCHIAIETKLLLGQIDVDATAIGGNTHAMSLVGVGTGYGLFAKGSSGFRAEAQGTSGHGIAAVGIGGGFGVSISGASGRQRTDLFRQLEGPEPVPGDLANEMEFGKILSITKRRNTNKVTQDATTQKWYRDDSTTLLASRTVSDDLTTQTQGKLF